VKRLIALAILAVALTGCSVGVNDDLVPGQTPPLELTKDSTVVGTGYSFKVNTVDGREIPCVYIARSLSCDWSIK
jgi:hypothetical protein